jgi:hypothetical protein
LSDTSSSPKKSKDVALPTGLVDQIEKLMQTKFERRPGKVAMEAYLSELLRYSLEREQARELFTQVLEEYSVDKEHVFVKDNERDVVAELSFKDNSDLYCDIDSSKNCVHIGFAWSIPAVQRLIYDRKSRQK